MASILVAAGSPAFATDYTVTDSASSQNAFTNSVAGDTVTFNMTGENVYLHDSRNNNHPTLSGNAVIEQVRLTNAFSGCEYIFAGSVSGTGEFTYIGNMGGNNQTYTFNGSMEGYSGSMEIVSDKTGTLNFNNTTIGSATAAGRITATGADSHINLNGSTSYASINASNLGISGASTVNGAVSAVTLNMADNSVLNGGDSASITATNLIATGADTVNATVTISGKLDVAGITSAIAGTGTLNIGSAAINISTEQFNNGNVSIFDSGLTVNGQDTATISVNGVALNERYAVTWSNGTLVSVVASAITWNGGDAATTWNTSDQSWTVNGGATAFMQGDEVRFNSSATLGLDGNINVYDMIISGEGTTVTLGDNSTGNLIVANGLSIENGATLVLGKETGGVGLVQGEVTVKDGGTLQFNAHDVTGFNGGASSLHTINVEKGGRVFQNQGSNETFAGTLNLEGAYDGLENSILDLYGGSAQVVVGNDNADAAINVQLRLRRDNAAISVGSNSTLTVKGITVGNGGNGIIAKAGAGLLKATGNVNINGVNVNAGGVEFSGGGSVGSITMGATNTSLSFNGEGKSYTAGVISTQASNSTTRELSVGSGATLNAAALNNNWGMRSITVNGTLNLVHATNDGGAVTQTGALVLSSGSVTTTIGGSGTINAYALQVGNVGTYNITVHELNIGEGGWTKSPSTITTVHIKEGSTVNVNGLATGIKADVDGGTLNFNGNVASSTILVKGGVLNLDSKAETATVTMEGGTFNINDTANEHAFTMIDGASGGGRGAGTVNFKQGTTSSIGQLWGNQDKAEFLLEKDAKVKLANNTVTVTGQEGGSSIASTKEENGTGGSQYSAAATDWDIIGATVSLDGVANGELKNKLVGSSLVNASGNAVTATNTASTYNAIEARGNDITVQTTDAGATAQSLYVGKGHTVTFATADGTATKATLGKSAEILGNVAGQIAWEPVGDAATNTLTLNTVYDAGNGILTTIATGSTINFMTDGRIDLGASGGHTNDLGGKNLTLTATITLDGNAADAVATRWLIAGDSIWFRDNWDHNQNTTLVNFETFKITESTGKELTRYANAGSLDDAWTSYGETATAALGDPVELGAGAYRYVATAEGIGVQYYQKSVPEPATATLSLLALAALAARRRRKA